MKKTGAWLARYALEQIGIRYTFGIPGVHNTELYDELNASDTITPILVTHEGGGAFMADAVSRLSPSTGCLVVVPAAGVTHAASGIGEAFLDGIPMMILCGGVRTDLPFKYQLHQLDQQALMAPLCKKTYKITRHEDVIPTLYEAHNVAISGEPGPVFVEIPVNIQLLTGEVSQLPQYQRWQPQSPPSQLIEQAAQLIASAQKPCIFAGWGAKDAATELIELAERLGAPVSTTLQGLSVFPGDHPLHTGFGFGPAAVPAARESFKDCDCLIAIGTRFGEIATGSYGITPPAALIHIDINPDALNANYPAKVAIAADARLAIRALLTALPDTPLAAGILTQRQHQIKKLKKTYVDEWLNHDSGDRVNPAIFFKALRTVLPRDSTVVVDDGNHTFLTAELLPIYQPGGFISPTDFNCMGYSVPAAIGAKLVRPDTPVVTIVGDGCFAMTCMEIATAVQQGLGVVYFVFNDGELSQIAQAQEIPYNRKACTVLPAINFEGIARGVGAEYLALPDNRAVEGAIREALNLSAQGRPVIVDVRIDYSKRSAFTQGIVKTNLQRFNLGTKVRLVARAIGRRITG